MVQGNIETKKQVVLPPIQSNKNLSCHYIEEIDEKNS
jgi:hypothetical protein